MAPTPVTTTEPATGPHLPNSIEGPNAAARCGSASEERVGEVRHDLDQRHEWWLVQQYLEGLGEA